MENDETNQIAGFGEFRGMLANWEKKHSSTLQLYILCIYKYKKPNY